MGTEPVGDASTLLRRLKRGLRQDATILVGFDFPIGLPRRYAARAGFRSFREALRVAGHGDWAKLLELSDSPTLYQPFAPASNIKGGLTRDQLASALGLRSPRDLLRLCDRETVTRRSAEALFYTRFSKQVGRAAIHGWRTLLVPAVEDPQVTLWPFDGDYQALVSQPGTVIVEVYPAEAVAHFGLKRGAPGRKNDAKLRIRWCDALAARAMEAGIQLSDGALRELREGCNSEDSFDALVSLVSMLTVVLGRHTAAVPRAQSVRQVEGWIFGQVPEGAQSEEIPAPKSAITTADASGRPEGSLVYCPRCRGTVSAEVVFALEVPIEDEADGLEYIDEAQAACEGGYVPPDAIGYGPPSGIYSLLRCPKCHHPILAYRYDFQLGDAMTRLWPPPRQIDWRIPEHLRRTFGEAVQCFEAGSYVACLLMCRRTIEMVCRLRYPNLGALSFGLTQLHKDGVIDARLFAWATALRQDGNLAAHEPDLQPSIQDVSDLLDFTEAILNYVFVLSKRFEEFKERRVSPTPTDKEGNA